MLRYLQKNVLAIFPFYLFYLVFTCSYSFFQFFHGFHYEWKHKLNGKMGYIWFVVVVESLSNSKNGLAKKKQHNPVTKNFLGWGLALCAKKKGMTRIFCFTRLKLVVCYYVFSLICAHIFSTCMQILTFV